MSTSFPGISFETVTPPLSESLPRMDIAGFVGFSQRGPIGTPVPVEDMEQFGDVFGGAVELALNRETGRTERSYLPSAVQAFFQNGGRRCWVIRVAHPRDDGPSEGTVYRSEFGLPGVVSIENGRPTTVQARCFGASFDSLRVGTVLRRDQLPDPTEVEWSSPDGSVSTLRLRWASNRPDPLAEGELVHGDLLSLTFHQQVQVSVSDLAGDPITDEGPLFALTAATKENVDPTSLSLQYNTIQFIDGSGDEISTYIGEKPEDAEGIVVDPPAVIRDSDDAVQILIKISEYTAEIASFSCTLAFDGSALEITGVSTEARLTPDSASITVTTFDNDVFAYAPVATESMEPLNGSAEAVETGSIQLFEEVPTVVDDASDRLDVTVTLDAPPESDHLALIETTFQARLERIAGGDEPSFRIEIDEDTVSELDEADVPLQDVANRVARVTGPGDTFEGWLQLGPVTRRENEALFSVQDALWPVSTTDVIGEMPGPPVKVAERLRFDLLVWHDHELEERLHHLGFSERHSRGWTGLPTDEDLFTLTDGDADIPLPGTLPADAFSPRFSLAASESPGESPFVPLGMADRPDFQRTRSRLPRTQKLSRLERERLSSFSTDLFVDTDLATESTDTLADRADEQFLLPEGQDVHGQSGLHSFWPVREVTLCSLPDAYHREWTERPQTIDERVPNTVPVPTLAEVEGRDSDPAEIYLSWSLDADGAYSFEVQESTDAEFSSPSTVYRGDETEATRYVRSDRSQSYFFRVRAIRREKRGAWSRTRAETVPEADFLDCGVPLTAPAVTRTESGNRGNTIMFEPLGDEPTGFRHYEIQVSPDASFSTVHTVAQVEPEETGTIEYTLNEDRPAVVYARVRAVTGPAADPTMGPWSSTIILKRRLPTKRVLVSPEEYDQRQAAPAEGREGLLRLQRSALRFAAAQGDVLVMMGSPQHDQAEHVRSHLRRLTTLGPGTGPAGERLGHEESRTLSFGAFYHPWLMHASEPEGELRPIPPGGAITGLAALQALTDGPWIPPANVSVRGSRVLRAFRGEVSDGLGRMNRLRKTPRGVLTLEASTLADEDVLRPISARRVLSLVRRLAVREGPELVFDSQSVRLRRRVAEQFEGLLRQLFERGALAGSIAAEAYRVVTNDSVNPPSRRERGEIVVELRIAPSRPLEFITVRLIPRNGRMVAVAS